MSKPHKYSKPCYNPFRLLRYLISIQQNTRLVDSGGLTQHTIDTFISRRKEAKNSPQPQWFRNHLAACFKKARKYEVKESWKFAWKQYDLWQKINTPIEPVIGTWVTLIADWYPCKGKLFAEHYINENYPRGPRTFRVHKIYGDGLDRDLVSDSHDESFNIEQCRYAHPVEIRIEGERRTHERLMKHVNLLPIQDEL